LFLLAAAASESCGNDDNILLCAETYYLGLDEFGFHFFSPPFIVLDVQNG
jgi:hypothetical protein